MPVNIHAGVTGSGAIKVSDVSSASRGVDSYYLSSGDMIHIQVFGEAELNMDIRLNSSGVINYPFLGKIRVKGLTVEELQNRLIRGLKDGYLRSPQVNVSIVEHRSYFIEGEVNKPGAYPYQPGLTVGRAILLAGGYAEFATRDYFNLLQDKSHSMVIVAADALVGPGDSITVGKSIFYIIGEVNNPGSYPHHSGLTLREAISLAGGLTERASDSNILIVSASGSEHTPGRLGLGVKIVSGDSIHIKQSFF